MKKLVPGAEKSCLLFQVATQIVEKQGSKSMKKFAYFFKSQHV